MTAMERPRQPWDSSGMSDARPKPRLFVARTAEPDPGMPGGYLNMEYLVVAASEQDAVGAIWKARKRNGQDQCAVTFDYSHTLDEAAVIGRLSLMDGVARPLA